MADFQNDLTSFYRMMEMAHVSDPQERKNIEEQTIKIYKALLNAFIPTINKSLENIDSTIDECKVIIKEKQ